MPPLSGHQRPMAPPQQSIQKKAPQHAQQVTQKAPQPQQMLQPQHMAAQLAGSTLRHQGAFAVDYF